MPWVLNWRLCRPLTLLLLPLALWAAPVRAQNRPGGNGLKGDYYNGVDFDDFVVSRRDATIAFDWKHQPPAPGVTTEYFSVRWSGWLVPPASGRYVFHATIDDGMRIWLNGRLILNEWRPQRVWTFTTAVELKAGESYELRVEYFQDILDTRAQLTWERPDAPAAAPKSSWRNLWGLAADQPAPSPIPTRYLFSQNPKPAPARPAEAVAPVGVAASPRPPVPAKARRPVAPPRPVARAAFRPPEPVRALLKAPPVPVPTDSVRGAQLAGLAVGEGLTVSELYFNRGQARLLPPVRAALDGLAATLHAQPGLRFEVQGHTDNVGNAELNRQLSQQRAEAVCLYLTAHGVADGQLRPVGYGGTRPVADNADPAQRPRNRRVVLQRR